MYPHSTALNAARRTADWNSLADAAAQSKDIDLLVIGAGITGAGIALDAASRGLDVVLIDAHDLAFGTSRWSSKLAHGGLRYLASGNVGIARRSARERGILMETTAPHLTRALPQVVPVRKEYSIANKVLPRLGFIAGDALRVLAGTKTSTLPWSKTVKADSVQELSPTVKMDGLQFGYVNHDGQLVDDARLVTAIARTAAGYGAKVLTHVRAVSATGTTAELRDELTGDTLSLTPRAVVNATGVWAGDLASNIKVRPSRGTHLVVAADKLGNPTGALTVPVPGHTNRFCFILPAPHGRVYIGLTDEDALGPIPDVPEVPEEDIDFLLDVVNPALEQPLTRADIDGAFAGLRPLIDAGEGHTADLSREHALVVDDTGLITITGGKLTEYRLMAEQTVDKVVERLGATVADCFTDRIGLVGAQGLRDDKPATGIPPQLAQRYGSEAKTVLDECLLDRPEEPVAEGLDVLRAEFSWYVTHEGALTVDDIVDRRCRLGLVPTDRAKAEACANEAIALI